MIGFIPWIIAMSILVWVCVRQHQFEKVWKTIEENRTRTIEALRRQDYNEAQRWLDRNTELLEHIQKKFRL